MEGYDIRKDMASVYGLMGVCPQHDLLWEQLTAREHLIFYGRLKNLKVPPTLTPMPGHNLYPAEFKGFCHIE